MRPQQQPQPGIGGRERGGSGAEKRDEAEERGVFSMDDDLAAGGGPPGPSAPSALGDRDALDDRDEVFTSSAGGTESAGDGRRGGGLLSAAAVAAARGLYVPAAPLPISGAAYHFRAHRAWLSTSAPHGAAAAFYLGLRPPSAEKCDSDLDLDLDGDVQARSGGVDGGATQGARRPSVGPQPLPDLVPRTGVDAFRRRTFSESSVGALAVREFASELRRISDAFEDEVHDQRAASTARRWQTTARTQGLDGGAATGDVVVVPDDVAGHRRPIAKRRSSSFMQDLKDLLRKSNPPSSL